MGDYGEGVVVGALVEGVGISVHPRSSQLRLAGWLDSGGGSVGWKMIGGSVWCHGDTGREVRRESVGVGGGVGVSAAVD